MRFTHWLMALAAVLAAVSVHARAQEPALLPPPPGDAPEDPGRDYQPVAVEPRETLLEQRSHYRETIEMIERHLAAFPVAAPVSLPGEALQLDVETAVNLALAQNAQVLVAADDVDVAEARVGQAESQWLPQVSGRVSHTWTEYNTPEQSGLQSLLSGLSSIGGLGGAGSLGSVFSLGGSVLSEQNAAGMQPDEELTRHELDITQVLYTGGQRLAAMRAARHLATAQDWQRLATLAQVEFDAKQAFYDALLAQALVRVAEESVKTFERSLSDAQQMFDVGMISNFEVLRAQTELGARQADLVAAQNGLRLALANLRRVLFLPEGTPLTLDPTIRWAPPTVPMESFVHLAYERRPELLALESSAEAADQDVRRVRGTYHPRVAAQANYANTDGGGLATPDGWTFTVGAEWELFAGGRREFDVLEARAQADKAEHQLLDLRRLVELDVTRSYIQIQDAMAKVDSERGTVELATEGLRLAELRFQEGVGTQSEVLDAELALTNAETSLIQALREYAVANASLEKAAGLSWFRDDLPAEKGDPEKPNVEDAAADLQE